MSTVYDIPLTKLDRTASVNSKNLESAYEAVRRLGEEVGNPGQAVVITKKDHTGLYLPYANYGGFASDETRSFISCAPGATFGKQIQITGNAIIHGAFLDCENNIPAVVVKAGGRVILQNCHITKKDGSQSAATDSYVAIETGGYASVNGCFFHGLQSDTGSIVYNADAGNPGRVAVVGCVNLTDIVTTPYINITFTQDVP